MSPTNEPRMTKAERTAQARAKAKLIREAQLKKEKRRSWLIRGGVVAAAVAIVVIIAVIVIQTQRGNEPIASSGQVPANANSYGGVTVGKNGAIVAPTTTEKTVDVNSVPAAPSAAATSVADPGKIGIKASASGKPAQVVVYLDFMCPACNQFESTYGPGLNTLRDEGKITVEYRALPFLDRFSSGTNYSSRAAAAAACVVDQSPEKYKAFLDSLYANQPKENSSGLDNAALGKLATEAGAASITSCVDAKTYRPFVAFTGALGASAGVNATPTVFVDGQQWMPDKVNQFSTFLDTVLAAKK
ncbi:disulfide bond formation protein DsbA [Arthrobacter livingstonensis]|uniref:Disulfide bond formation protein DsbA n=1 Tax=Arthrobacter livingstonensis TaxID=670078 RepID=A0A2V5L4B2_9MICC|nr:DsbA family protein [Arthrobacter livingstonensis]PYI65968.1 disulfide bond formation protein DsbA [Arthrobacter livingstonensis]